MVCFSIGASFSRSQPQRDSVRFLPGVVWLEEFRRVVTAGYRHAADGFVFES